MIEYKGVNYNITDEPNLNGKGRMFMHSINFKPLIKLNASTFDEAKKIAQKLIENASNRKDIY